MCPHFSCGDWVASTLQFATCAAIKLAFKRMKHDISWLHLTVFKDHIKKTKDTRPLKKVIRSDSLQTWQMEEIKIVNHHKFNFFFFPVSLLICDFRWIICGLFKMEEVISGGVNKSLKYTGNKCINKYFDDLFSLGPLEVVISFFLSIIAFYASNN